jgi:hypothetical protein
MFRVILFPLLMLSSVCVFGTSSFDSQVSDTIKSQIEYLKQFLYSDEWEPVDAETNKRIEELVDYLENTPIDSVVTYLMSNTDSVETFIERDINNIQNTYNVSGYIDSVKVDNELEAINKSVKNEIPLESIIVPEDKFIGGYSSLPIITYGEIERLVSDSIVVIPDSLLLMVAEASQNSQQAQNADSLVVDFLDRKRKAYNDSVINAYRDSIVLNYRETYQKDIIDSLQQKYIDSIKLVNEYALTKYNDLVSASVNKQFSQFLSSLLTYAYRIPNELTIYNLQEEGKTFKLQNQEIWYKWIWLKNQQNDSLGIRIENIDKHSIRVLIDETVNLSRLTQQRGLEIKRVDTHQKVDENLKEFKPNRPELSHWKTIGKVYTGITETFINDYWSKGGKSSASSLSTLKYSANYSKNKFKWENNADAKLGFVYYLDDNADVPFNKTSDDFELNSRFGFEAFNEWYYSGEANFKTQLLRDADDNTDVLKSTILSPAYLTFSGGFDYKPNSNMSIFLSPLSLKTTFVTNPRVDETKYSIDEGESRKSRMGLTGRLKYSKEVMENINIETKNNIFINFGNKDGEWQFFKMPDLDSETSIDFKVNQFISTQINFHFIYDKEVESSWTDESGIKQKGTRLQVKQYLTIGAAYNF